ncbi:MAG: tRNA (guanosine(37)-N1)-methyltransferase TrmD [Planctomycetes bacterium]|nr:tRNA (guanosine(37)-N1)-methyltransferase TrmD [Planctomycetota bacterium]
MRIDLLTLFPNMFDGVFAESIVKRACDKGWVEIVLTNIRDFASDKHRSVDDRPYGGGPGMVLMCQPVFDAVESVLQDGPPADEIILLTPQGETLNQNMARELSEKNRLLMLAGHYEGFDERIRTELATREISIGDYVLSGGEIPAMVVIDAMVRLIPGVLGDSQSIEEESFTDNQLEYPQYTRPENFKNMKVPDVLLSGNHQKIKTWRREQSRLRTQTRRPDLEKN